MRSKAWTNRVVLITAATAFALISGALCATVGNAHIAVPYIFTETPRYDPDAWLDGRDRFPVGASLILVTGDMVRELAPAFYASTDAAVSYDGRRVLFSGKPTPADPWQIWEVALEGGAPRLVARETADCLRPLYLPGGPVVYTRAGRDSSAIALAGNAAPLSYAPGRYLTDDVLQDGRILFEAAQGARQRELFTVYPDGTGVEALRCDHGPDRGEARQLASGDYLFRSGTRLARITSALAAQTEVVQPEGKVFGPVAELAPGLWLVGLHTRRGFGLYRWNATERQTAPVETPANASAVEAVVVAARTPPREFPSALVATRKAGNLLCLNARASRGSTNSAAVQTVRVLTQEGLLGETAVEPDGSFYIQVPADRPLRIELADAAGRTIQAEHGWFWMRPSEQRICVGCHAGPERAPENQVPEILLKTIVPVPMLEVKP